MTDSLKTRVARLIAGHANAIVDRIEDSSRVEVLSQNAREIDDLAAEVRGELGKAAATRHLLLRKQSELNAEHSALESSVLLAVAGNKEELARAGVGRQVDIEAQLPILEQELAQLASQEKEQAALIEALQGKSREMLDAIAALKQADRVAGQVAPAGAGKASLEARVAGTEASFNRVLARGAGTTLAGAGVTLGTAVQLNDLKSLARDSKIEERMRSLKSAA